MPPRVEIVPVWNHYYFQIQSNRGWSRLRCPEHEDGNASAQINTEEGKWVCFACSFSEDALDIIMRKESVSFGRALAIAADITGESLDEVRGSRRRSSSVPRGPRARDAGDGQLTLGSRPRRRS